MGCEIWQNKKKFEKNWNSKTFPKENGKGNHFKMMKRGITKLFPISEDQRQTSYDNIQHPCNVEFLIISGKSLHQIRRNNCVKRSVPLFPKQFIINMFQARALFQDVTVRDDDERLLGFLLRSLNLLFKIRY